MISEKASEDQLVPFPPNWEAQWLSMINHIQTQNLLVLLKDFIDILAGVLSYS